MEFLMFKALLIPSNITTYPEYDAIITFKKAKMKESD